MKLPSYVSEKNLTYGLIALLVVSIFFPLRYVFKLPNNFVTGAYSDFTSFSLYSCDLVILGLVFFVAVKKQIKLPFTKVLIALAIWLTFVLILRFNQEIGLNIYFFVKILELIVLHETLKNQVKPLKTSVFKLFASLGVIESVIACIQFLNQKSIGLYRIGEQRIDSTIQGIAKVPLDKGTFIRAYGTFPHPNLLSAFLLGAILISLGLLVSSETKKERIAYSTILAMNIFGLFMSFSRAALIALAISAAFFFLAILIKQGFTRIVIVSGVIMMFSVVSAALVFKPFLLARTNLISDQSAKERIFYANIGLSMIKNYPFTGIGIGTSMLHMQQYSPLKLEPWEIQPIHNYFLLSAAEFGVPGAIILVILFLSYLKDQLWMLKKHFDIYNLSLLSIFVGFLVLMMFDHYFYTIEQTQILLWLILGMIAAEIYSAKQNASP